MARDEMDEITADRWDDDIWGSAIPSPDNRARPAKLVFYFGEKDHWVADETREQLMKVRGRLEGDDLEEWKPIMEIDTQDVPHSFCIRKWIKYLFHNVTEC